MRKLILTALVFTLLHAGEYADAFLQTSVPAASMGMGRVVLTPLVGLASVAGNPAGLAQSENREYLFQYADLFGMAFHTGAGISFPLSRNRQLAFSWYRTGVNDIPLRPDLSDSLSFLERRAYLRENFGGSWESFSDREDALFITYGKIYRISPRPGWAYDPVHIQIPVAVNFKVLSKSVYENRARGMGADLGIKLIIPGSELFYFRHLGTLTYGVTIQDIYVSGLYWDTGHVDLIDMAVHHGFSLDQPVPGIPLDLLVSYDISNMTGEGDHIGAELGIFDVLFLRVGRDESSWTMGTGLNFNAGGFNIKADYSFREHDLDPSHRISLYLTKGLKNE